MNIKKIEKQAKKINQLIENIKEEGSVSAIEKDLLLSYIRDMYEKVTGLGEDYKVEKSEKSAPKKIVVDEPVIQVQQPEPVRTPVVQIADVVREEVKETVAAQTYSAPVEVATPAIEEEIVADSKPQIPEELEVLFTPNAISEISDKLSRSPISDLTKCMGINEKIFTVKELFGGDSDLFTKTMSALNNLSSLEQAKEYLVDNVALDNNWASDSKIKKAANFINLISRRY